jgi:hypothetical protein
LKELVTLTMRAALRYRKYSSRFSARIAADSRIAPTARIESGHRSRSSKTKGRHLKTESTQAAQAVKNCGEVETITFGRGRKRPARKPVTMKLR